MIDMRVLLGNKIFICKYVASNLNEDNVLLLISNNDCVYEVDCESKEIRNAITNNLLKHGWVDLSNFTYKMNVQN